MRMRSLGASALLLPALALVPAAGVPLPPACDAAAVGGGWAGVYYAWRLAEEGRQVCLFEASGRIGGRTYSHTFEVGRPGESFTLDVGAYRFSPDMHLPGDVILDVLKLPVSCYEPSCPDASVDFPQPFHFNYSAPLVRIVDSVGNPAGYASALEGLVQRIRAKGGSIFMFARLTDAIVLPNDGGVKLMFDEQAVVVKNVLLNLPRNELLRLPSLQAATAPRTLKAQQCVKFDLPGDMFPPGHSLQLGRALTKAYAFYEDAWWHTLLNRTEGQYPTDAFEPLNTSEAGIPIGIHFNDGPVHCDAPLKGCRGFLEVFYALADESFFESLRSDPYHPLGMLTTATDTTGKLHQLHSAIMWAVSPLFQEKGISPPTAWPTMLAVGVWDRTGEGYTAPTKVYYSSSDTVPGGPDPLEKACGLPGLTEDEYRRAVMAPVQGNLRLLVANNDWVAQTVETFFGDWAEESLLQAERGLRLLGYQRPAWLNATYYEAKVAAFAALGQLQGPAPPKAGPAPAELMV